MTGLGAELYPFRLALRDPLVTGGVSIRFRAGLLVSLAADGVTGWGEASPLPGWSRNSLLETEDALRRTLDGIDAGGEAALDALVGDLGDAPHARSGVTGAWADLQARRAGRPLVDYLVAQEAKAGRAGRSLAEHLVADPVHRPGTSVAVNALAADPVRAPAASVAVNALIVAPEPSEVEEAAHDAVEAGFMAVKLKVGAGDPAVDMDRVQAARAGLGPAAELRLDANGAWDQATAIEVLGSVQGCDIAYCEEPVAGIEAIAALGRRSPIAVAVDESMRSQADAVQALDLGVSNLIVKPQALGGPDVALTIAARAHEAGARVTVTSFLDSAVGLAHALHVAAAVDAIAPHWRAHGLATADLLSADVADLPPVTAGVMSLPPGYGIGVAPAL